MAVIQNSRAVVRQFRANPVSVAATIVDRNTLGRTVASKFVPAVFASLDAPIARTIGSIRPSIGTHGRRRVMILVAVGHEGHVREVQHTKEGITISWGQYKSTSKVVLKEVKRGNF